MGPQMKRAKKITTATERIVGVCVADEGAKVQKLTWVGMKSRVKGRMVVT